MPAVRPCAARPPETRRGGEQRAATGQQAVLHRSAQQVEVCLRHRRPIGVDVGLAVGHYRHHRGRLQHLLRLLRGVQPVHQLPLRQRPLAMRDRIYPVTAPDIATHQAKARPAGGIHRDHCVHQHAVCIALLHRTKATATLGCGRELHLAAILDRQNVPSGAGLTGSVSPALNQLLSRHFRIGEEPPGLQLTSRSPPSRRKHTVLRKTICSRIAAPLCRGADLRMTQGTFPWRLLCSVSRATPIGTRPASHKDKMLRQEKMSGHSIPDITCVHALARKRGPRRQLGPAFAVRHQEEPAVPQGTSER